MISWNLKTRNLRPIGLDIGHSSIKMIQLAVNDSRIEVVAADKVRIDASLNGDGQARRKFTVSAIKQMLAASGFRGKNVVTCVPSDKLRITSLRLAEAEVDQIEQALAKEAAQRFGLDPDKDTVNYMLAGSVRQGDEVKNEYILFATDNETIRNHIAMLEEVQLRPVAIDTVPSALFKSFERSLRRQEDKERTVVFVDLGSKYTTAVFGREEEIRFVKRVAIGGENFNQDIAAKLGVDVNEVEMLRGRLKIENGFPAQNSHSSESVPAGNGQQLDASTRQVMVDATTAIAEELARELSLCFRYYTVTFRGKRVNRAIFAGGEAYDNILLNVLRRQLAVEVEVAQPLRGIDMSNVDIDSSKQGLLCEWAVAVGLSLNRWSGSASDNGAADKSQERILVNSGNDERN